MDWRPPRSTWALDPGVVHLNHGSYGAVPAPVREVQRHWREQAESNPNRFHSRTLKTEMDRVREVVSGFVGAGAPSCVLMPNVTNAMAVALASLPLRPGDEMVISDHAYVGVQAAARATCLRAGARLIVASTPPDTQDGATIAAQLLGTITDRTRAVVVDHVTSPTALLVDVAPLTATLRARGITVIVDGAHAPGALPLDVSAIDADFYCGDLHKWCCAPRGAAFLAAQPGRVASLLPAVPGAHADRGHPESLEWWGTTDYSALLSVPAALDFFAALGWDRVRHHNNELATHGRDIVAIALGLCAHPPSPVPMAAITLRDRGSREQAERLRDELSDAGVEVAVVHDRGALAIRLSAQLYNEPSDYHQLADLLAARVVEQPAPSAH